MRNPDDYIYRCKCGAELDLEEIYEEFPPFEAFEKSMDFAFEHFSKGHMLEKVKKS